VLVVRRLGSSGHRPSGRARRLLVSPSMSPRVQCRSGFQRRCGSLDRDDRDTGSCIRCHLQRLRSDHECSVRIFAIVFFPRHSRGWYLKGRIGGSGQSFLLPDEGDQSVWRSLKKSQLTKTMSGIVRKNIRSQRYRHQCQADLA